MVEPTEFSGYSWTPLSVTAGVEPVGMGKPIL